MERTKVQLLNSWTTNKLFPKSASRPITTLLRRPFKKRLILFSTHFYLHEYHRHSELCPQKALFSSEKSILSRESRDETFRTIFPKITHLFTYTQLCFYLLLI